MGFQVDMNMMGCVRSKVAGRRWQVGVVRVDWARLEAEEGRSQTLYLIEGTLCLIEGAGRRWTDGAGGDAEWW